MKEMDAAEKSRSAAVDDLNDIFNDLQEQYIQKLIELDDLRKEIDCIWLMQGRLNR